MKRISIVCGWSAGALLLLTINASGQTLPVNTGLKLWLKADAGVTATANGEVTGWADQSSIGNNAAQADVKLAPTLATNSLNGKPTLRFPGGTRYMDVPNTPSITGLTEDVTILVLVNHDDFSTYRTCVSKTTGNGPAPFDVWHNQGVNGGRVSLYLGDGVPANYRQFYSTAPPRAQIWNVFGFAWGGGVVNQYLNDLDNGQGTYTIVPADAGGPFRIGSRADKVTQLQGNLAEILIYQPKLSDTDRNAVIAYLAEKWGVAFNKAPVVSIQTPTDGLSVPAGSLTVTVNASDPDGTVKRVDLLNNGVVIASMPKAPYQVTLAMLNPGTAKLTAIAVDDFDRAATATPVTVTITGSAPSAPVADGLKVWLRADAGTTTDADNLVSTWNDQSPAGNNAVAGSAPLLVQNVVNGKPVVRFGPNAITDNQFLDIPDAGTAFAADDLSTFVVARFADFASYRALWSKSLGAVAGPIDWWFAPGSGIANAYRGDGTTQGGPIASTTGVPAGQFVTVGLTVQGTAISHYLAHAENGVGTIAATTGNGGAALRIGQRDDGVPQMVGDIAEILIYERALSPLERSNVVSYLSAKYGMAQAIIGNQPPTAIVVAPTNNFSTPAGSAIEFGVTAADSDGTVAQVQLYANGGLIATFTNSPYQLGIELLSPGTVSLTGVAVDNWGARGTSAPVSLIVSGSAPATPPTTDLRLWLKADDGPSANGDGTLISWADKSGKGNNAVPSGGTPSLVASVVNGKPAVRFDGTGAALEVAASTSTELAGDFTTFAMVKFDDFATYRALWAKTVGNAPGIDYYAQPNSGAPNLLRGNTTLQSYGNFTGTRGIPAGAWSVVGYDMVGTRATHYLDGAANGSGNINATFVDSGGLLLIGTRDDRATVFKGDMAELLIYGRALTDVERTQAEAYLAGKYGRALVRMASQPPVLSITSPVANTTSAAPATISFAVKIDQAMFRLARLDFLADNVLLASQDLTAVDPQPTDYSITVQALTPGKVVLQARAVDVWGNLGESLPVTARFTGTGPAAPPSQGLVVWLKADAGVSTNGDGTVTTWADQSGQTNNAAATDPGVAPVLAIDPATTRPTLQFDEGDFLDIVSAPSVVIEGDISSFCGYSVADFTAVRSIWSKTTAARAYPNYYFVRGGTTVVARGNSDGVSDVAAANPLPVNTPVATGFTIEGSDTIHYLNGRANGRASLGYGALDQGSPLRIGATEDMSNPFKGNISEILIYNRALSAAEVELASTYLAARNGIAVVQLSTAPAQPALAISRISADSVRISWPAEYTGFTLEFSETMETGSWAAVTPAPTGNETVVTSSTGVRYYRLRK